MGFASTGFIDTMSVPRSLQSTYAAVAAPPTPERPLHVVLACTGSVASVKVPLIVERLASHRVHVYVVASAASQHFFSKAQVDRLDERATAFTTHDLAEMNRTGLHRASTPRVRVWTDEDEWTAWKALGDPVLHIELRRWADLVLVAPCSADTLAKLSHGLCDNMLTSFMRALSPTTPIWLYPAMNTLMYMHPLTSQQIAVVESFGYKVYGPISKRLACGDIGDGAMVEWQDIVQQVKDAYVLD